RVPPSGGAGRPEAPYVVERLVETAARELKIDPAELRRRNFIRNFPYQTPVALQYDTGDYDATLDAALKLADVSGFSSRKQDSMKNGKLRGIGYAAYIEACGIAPSAVAGSLGARAGLFEAGEIRVHPTGSVTVFTGSPSPRHRHDATSAPSHRRGSWSPPASACRSRASTSCTATLPRSSSAWAPTARVRSPWAAR